MRKYIMIILLIFFSAFAVTCTLNNKDESSAMMVDSSTSSAAEDQSEGLIASDAESEVVHDDIDLVSGLSYIDGAGDVKVYETIEALMKDSTLVVLAQATDKKEEVVLSRTQGYTLREVEVHKLLKGELQNKSLITVVETIRTHTSDDNEKTLVTMSGERYMKASNYYFLFLTSDYSPEGTYSIVGGFQGKIPKQVLDIVKEEKPVAFSLANLETALGNLEVLKRLVISAKENTLFD